MMSWWQIFQAIYIPRGKYADVVFFIFSVGCATAPTWKKPGTLTRKLRTEVQLDGTWKHTSRIRMQINPEEFVYCENTQVVSSGEKTKRVSWEADDKEASKTFTKDALMKVYERGSSSISDEACLISKCKEIKCKLSGDTNLNAVDF